MHDSEPMQEDPRLNLLGAIYLEASRHRKRSRPALQFINKCRQNVHDGMDPGNAVLDAMFDERLK